MKRIMIVIEDASEMNSLIMELDKQGKPFVIVSSKSHTNDENYAIVPDVFLDAFGNKTPFDSTSNILNGIGSVIYGMPNKPDWVVVQGNSITAFSAALASYYSKIPIAFIEPNIFKEEGRMISAIAKISFPYNSLPEEIMMSLV